MAVKEEAGDLRKRAFIHQAEGGSCQEVAKVPLESLSKLTGFPVEFIKQELLLDEEVLSMGDLRKSMAVYLENTTQEMKLKNG